MRSVLGLLYLLQGLKAAGEDTEALMLRLSIDVALLDPASMIDLSLEYSLQQQIMQSVRRPGVGLYIGQQYNLAGYGTLLMLLMTSPSLMEALNMGVHYQRLTFLFGRIGLKQQGELMLLTYDSLERDPMMNLFRAECEMAGTYKLLKDMQAALGLKIPVVRVDLPYSAPKDPAVLHQYHAYYETDIRFDQPCGVLYSRVKDLNFAFPSADAVTHQRYRQQCDELLKQFEQDAGQTCITQQIRDYLMLQSGQIPPMSLVAQVLDLSERALRYRLTAENTSFRQIRDEVLYQKAQQLLHSLSVEEVAEQLCYSETAAFIHAFKRWSGQTPYQFKKGG
jgi:AraC-like DNA-binding protein